jgi:hypothetical protein
MQVSKYQHRLWEKGTEHTDQKVFGALRATRDQTPRGSTTISLPEIRAFSREIRVKTRFLGANHHRDRGNQKSAF